MIPGCSHNATAREIVADLGRIISVGNTIVCEHFTLWRGEEWRFDMLPAQCTLTDAASYGVSLHTAEEQTRLQYEIFVLRSSIFDQVQLLVTGVAEGVERNKPQTQAPQQTQKQAQSTPALNEDGLVEEATARQVQVTPVSVEILAEKSVPSSAPESQPEILDDDEVSALLRISRDTLRNHISAGEAAGIRPPYAAVAGRGHGKRSTHRWRANEVWDWFRAVTSEELETTLQTPRRKSTARKKPAAANQREQTTATSPQKKPASASPRRKSAASQQPVDWEGDPELEFTRKRS